MPRAYLGPEWKLQRPGECPSATTLANDVAPLPFLSIRTGGFARDRQTVLMDVDDNAFGRQAGQLKGCRHGIGLFGFVEVQSRERKVQ